MTATIGDPLISVASLQPLVGGSSVPTLLDVRWRLGGPPGIEAYRRGHVPGAVFVDLEADLSGPAGPGRHPLPDRRDFEAAMRRCGVTSRHPVVVYDAGEAVAAARAWWLLVYFGHPAVQVLDGGYDGWVAAGGEIGTDVPSPDPGDFLANPGHLGLIDAAGAAAVAANGVLLDVRAPERYRGEQEPVDPVAGHIPGARNLPVTGNLGADGRLHGASDLRRRFAAAGVEGDLEVGAYCGSGVTAAHEVLALAVAGIPAALYVGSWSDWITDPGRPIATGPED